MNGSEALDLRDLTPSSLLAPGTTEAKVFASAYTQTRFFDESGRLQPAGARSTYVTTTASLLHGIRTHWNAGLDVTIRGVRDDAFPEAVRSRGSIASIGPRVKWTPASGIPSLATQFSLTLPTAPRLSRTATRPFLDFGDPVASAQVLLDRRHSTRWLTYWEAGAFVRFGRAAAGEDEAAGDGGFSTPLKAILNFEPTRAWTVFAAEELFLDWQSGNDPAWYFQTGLGLKRRFAASLEVEALATTFPAGREKGAGATLGLGARRVW